MSEYRISVKIDPTGAKAGRAAIKQELKGMETDAAATGAAMSKFVVGGTTGSRALAAAQDLQTRRMTESSAAARKLGDSTTYSTKTKRDLEAAALRVMRAVDQEGVALAKVNTLLADARRAYDAGLLSAQNYAKVQAMAAQGSARVAQSLGAQRAGYTQLGYQIQDITQSLALGMSPMRVLAQQAGQTASAMELAFGSTGTAGKAARFMAGPWGSVLLAAGVILGGFAMKALQSGNALDEATDKLKKDAEETAVASRAKEAFGRTLEGVTAAAQEHEKALEALRNAGRSATEQNAIDMRVQVLLIQNLKIQTEAEIALARAMMETNRMRSMRGGAQQQEMAGASFLRSAGNLDAAQASLAKIDAQLVGAESRYQEALSFLSVEIGKELATQEGQINRNFDRQIEAARVRLLGEKATSAEIQRQTGLLEQQRARALEAARPSATVGVPTFQNRQQAIGMAGRELQGQGYRVDGNYQFGATGGHANNRDHNTFGADVNVGKGVVEANVPDLKARFDQLALSYQRRGYFVIWNGQKYKPFGNGPSGAAEGHTDHFHIYAPEVIVGKPTGASTAAQEAREYRAGESAEAKAAREAKTLADQKSDFIAGIENRAAKVGLPQDRKTQLAADIEAQLAEYKRRFTNAASPAEVAKITGALTEADARAQAEHFRVAYQYPLEQLQVTLGETGLQRVILNKILEEAKNKGDDLSETEKGMIENSVLQTAAFERAHQILEALQAPIDAYKIEVMALKKALDEGRISQEKYNFEMARVPMAAQAVDQGARLARDNDPAMADTNAISDKLQQTIAQLQEERNLAAQFYAAGILSEQEYQSRLTEIAVQEGQARVNADRQTTQMRLAAGQQMADALLGLAETAAGKQSAIYKVLFTISKGFTIATATLAMYQNIAAAMAKGWPQNIPLIAAAVAQGAIIISSIQAVAANFAEGGMVRGPGGPTDDRVAANLSDGEYVVKAAAVSRPGNRALLDAINSGNMIARSRQARNDNTIAGASMGGDTVNLSFGDVVVQAGNATAADGQAIGRDVKQALSELVDERLAKAQRPGGQLTRTRQSVVG